MAGKVIKGAFDELPKEKPKKKKSKQGDKLFYPIHWMEPPAMPGGIPTMRILGGATVRQWYKGMVASSDPTLSSEVICKRANDLVAEDDKHTKEVDNGGKDG